MSANNKNNSAIAILGLKKIAESISNGKMTRRVDIVDRLSDIVLLLEKQAQEEKIEFLRPTPNLIEVVNRDEQKLSLMFTMFHAGFVECHNAMPRLMVGKMLQDSDELSDFIFDTSYNFFQKVVTKDIEKPDQVIAMNTIIRRNGDKIEIAK